MNKAATAIDGHRIFSHSDKVAFREVEGEVLIVPIRMSASDPTGVYRLNRTASFIWAQMDGRQDVDAIVQQMVREFDVSAQEALADARELISDLLSIDAIVDADAP
ncbi:MAG: PqqD family protein [Deltaproteobacteria bacterium]|nr:PqqD family protein [Deltaproteobacteria bacterium]